MWRDKGNTQGGTNAGMRSKGNAGSASLEHSLNQVGGLATTLGGTQTHATSHGNRLLKSGKGKGGTHSPPCTPQPCTLCTPCTPSPCTQAALGCRAWAAATYTLAIHLPTYVDVGLDVLHPVCKTTTTITTTTTTTTTNRNQHQETDRSSQCRQAKWLQG